MFLSRKKDEKKELQDIINRLKAKKGVEGVIIATQEGALIESTVELNISRKYSKLLAELILQAAEVIKKMEISKVSFDSVQKCSYLRVKFYFSRIRTILHS